MLKVSNVLFTTDYSSCSDHALKHAIDLARFYKATLHVLHVNVLPAAANHFAITFDEAQALKNLEEHVTKKLTEFSASDVLMNAKIKSVSGLDAAETIIHYIESNEIDVCVMGTQGRTGLKHMMMGSVVEKVMRRARKPVFTMHESDRLVPFSQMKEILVPVDFSKSSEAVLDEAVAFAKEYDLRMNVIHVLPKHIRVLSQDDYIDVFKHFPSVLDESMERLRDFEKRHSHFNNLRLQVSKGNIIDEILSFINEHNVDLIIMAKRGYTFAEQLFIGRTTERLIQKTHIPLYILNS